jgi:hypothetical protein
MKIIIISLLFVFAGFSVSGQTKGTFDSTKKVYTIKTACGKCKFGLTGKTCELAVKINGNSYYVDGAAIDDFGDAHADDGFCKSVRKAKVQGEVVNGRFKASYFELLPEKKKKPKKKP